jgi:hypothetical protein
MSRAHTAMIVAYDTTLKTWHRKTESRLAKFNAIISEKCQILSFSRLLGDLNSRYRFAVCLVENVLVDARLVVIQLMKPLRCCD